MRNRLATTLRVETLEARDVPATFTWIYSGTGLGDSSVGTNWDGGVAPTSGNTVDVVIDSGASGMSLKQNRLRSITTPANWGGTISIDGGTTEIGGGISDYSYSYFSGTDINVCGDLKFDHGEVVLDDSNLFRDSAFQPVRTVTFYDNTYVTGGLEFGTYIVNNGTMDVNSAVQVMWSGASFTNSGQVNLTGTYTWNTYNSVNTNNIFTNNAGGTLRKYGSGTYTFGSFIHNEGTVSLEQGNLYLKGKATGGNAGTSSIHSYNSQAKLFLYGDTDLSADFTIWVDQSVMATRPGNDSYVTSVSGADLRLDTSPLDIGFTDDTGLNVLVVEYEVMLFNGAGLMLNFNGFMGYCDKLICNTLALGSSCSITVGTDGNPVSQFTTFTIVDTTAKAGNFSTTTFAGNLTGSWSGSDYQLSYVP